MVRNSSHREYFERHVARLLIVIYHCGQPAAPLIEGEMRQVDSIWQLQRFDFWVREPGHLALALLHAYAESPDRFAATTATVHEALYRMMADGNADTHRIILPGTPYSIFEDFDHHLSFLTSRALISDRPSFTRSRNAPHRIVLEASGVDTVRQIIRACPAYNWYRQQSQTVATFLPILEQYDLTKMSYLIPDLTPAKAVSTPLLPYIRLRYAKTFGESLHADVREAGSGDGPKARL
jgi:hypothetical protein